ncbi:hypothetical protein ONJ95_26970, partial [Salmonella enterica subsp. enterica serovar Virginia]|nr:hypothetical protein [Salmonella enterica subsp. enterica serovar Virginia]
TTQHWAVIRSVSKTLGPDLRLAIVASDSATSAKLRLRLNAGSWDSVDTAVKWLILVTFSISGMLVWQSSFAQEALTTQYSQSE